MLSWDGEKMTEDFTQSQIHIFSWKICSSLLRSDRNLLRLESYKNPITKTTYKASIAKLDQPNAADDDVQEISPPDAASQREISSPDAASKKENPPHDASKSETSGSLKRKRGRPRKIKPPKPISHVIDQFATNAIAERVEAEHAGNPNQDPINRAHTRNYEVHKE